VTAKICAAQVQSVNLAALRSCNAEASPRGAHQGAGRARRARSAGKLRRQKKDAAAAKELANQALLESQTAEDKADEAEQIVDAEESLEDSEDTDDVADEAAAVGDPHMTISTGDKLDLCCDGGVCKAC